MLGGLALVYYSPKTNELFLTVLVTDFLVHDLLCVQSDASICLREFT